MFVCIPFFYNSYKYVNNYNKLHVIVKGEWVRKPMKGSGGVNKGKGVGRKTKKGKRGGKQRKGRGEENKESEGGR